MMTLEDGHFPDGCRIGVSRWFGHVDRLRFDRRRVLVVELVGGRRGALVMLTILTLV